MTRRIIGIRHGEAWHNVLGDPGLGYEDTTLTVKGMRQALDARVTAPSNIDLIYCSPLIRTLQTASIIFPDKKIIALDCLMEYPQNTELCNKRSDLKTLSTLFPNVNFRCDNDNNWGVKDADRHLKSQAIEFKKVLRNVPEYKKIVVVSHSSWLKNFMFGSVGNVLEELPHCSPLPIDVEN